MKTTPLFLGFTMLTGLAATSCADQQPDELPNILWLTSEDNSPFAGCYGDEFATTPNLDQLASEGFLYTHAYANAPVCAPARNTIITGVYANSGGHQHMRSYYPKSELIHFLPQFLREKGYYCTNNHKEDYNMAAGQLHDIWDESSREAHYKNRENGQPFFAVFNTNISHESSIHKTIPTEQLRHQPDEVKLPSYHPDTPEMRHDWAQYYDKVEDMDAWVGKQLQALDEAGLAENTIVFYFGDHGGVLGRSKRFVYESGTHVPFIIRIPERYKHLFPAKKPGAKIDRLISFVDLAPTLLSIAGIPIPEYMQGKAFLGKQKTADPEYAYMFRGRMDERYDMSRAVRDQQFRYIRNYMPYRIYGQHINYLWKAPSMPSWEQAYLKGQCNPAQSAFWEPKPVEELYDTEKDPWEVHNLANDPNYSETLERLRKANKDWVSQIYDSGFIPEAERQLLADGQSVYDLLRTNQIPLKAIIDAAELATLGRKDKLPQLVQLLDHENESVRYWAATGLLILRADAREAQPKLEQVLDDSSVSVSIIAAEALYYLGEKEKALTTLLAALKHPSPFARTHALNVIDYTHEFTSTIQEALFQMVRKFEDDKSPDRYDLRVVEWLLDKNQVDRSNLTLNSAK
ncbi:sulfatase-like hydrolase/transferase [uncultured Sunxiuqinia sp.]|uniref:sulfatase-like hydrolase/transferase n=1 Tax=uncultured Sunxiuqinia sp. TaxID=1573825 RepID=UPI0026160357|nr:sulfatase-like hydrolase/transferase [uncultured Sunxiuqinia sp.]